MENTNRKILGYDFGFILGFGQGNLNKHWFFEYIIKRKPFQLLDRISTIIMNLH